MPAAACPFCSKTETSAELLHIHCLDQHPVEFLSAREREETDELQIRESLEEPPEPPAEEERRPVLLKKRPRPGDSPPPEPKRRRKPSPIRFDEGASAAKKTKKLSRKRPTSSLGEESGSEAQGPSQGPSGPPPSQRRVEVVAGSADSPPADQLLAVLPSPAPRCAHNLVRCLHFPKCRGRTCERQHPPCPRTSGDLCLRTNLCAFDHPRFEKACDHCEGRLSEASLRALPVICGHRRGIECLSITERRRCDYAAKCCYAHGPCPEGWECRRKGCEKEHPGQLFFCKPCKGLANKWRNVH